MAYGSSGVCFSQSSTLQSPICYMSGRARYHATATHSFNEAIVEILNVSKALFPPSHRPTPSTVNRE